MTELYSGLATLPASCQEMTSGESPVDYSVITATLNEAENIVELIQTITFQLDPLGKTFEIIVVDDNSTDGTATLVRDCSAANPHVKLASRPARNRLRLSHRDSALDWPRGLHHGRRFFSSA